MNKCEQEKRKIIINEQHEQCEQKIRIIKNLVSVDCPVKSCFFISPGLVEKIEIFVC